MRLAERKSATPLQCVRVLRLTKRSATTAAMTMAQSSQLKFTRRHPRKSSFENREERRTPYRRTARRGGFNRPQGTSW